MYYDIIIWLFLYQRIDLIIWNPPIGIKLIHVNKKRGLNNIICPSNDYNVHNYSVLPTLLWWQRIICSVCVRLHRIANISYALLSGTAVSCAFARTAELTSRRNPVAQITAHARTIIWPEVCTGGHVTVVAGVGVYSEKYVCVERIGK